MATVIDSLMIELGLDTSKFNTNQQKAVDQLRKFDDQAQKTSKNISKGAKDMGDGFTFMKDALVGFGTVFVGLNGFKSFIADTTKANAELGRSAHVLSMSAGELKTWGQMAELTGGNVESMTGTLKGLQQALAGLTVGDTGMVRATSMLGAWNAFDINKQTVDLYKLSDAIVKFKSTHTEAETVMWTQALGIDQSSLLLLEKGSQYLHEHNQEFSKLNESMNKNAEVANKLTEQWVFFKSILESIAQSTYGKLMNFLFIRKPNSTLTDQEWNNQVGYNPQGTNNSVPRNLRNNNPGNLKYNDYTKSLGATGADSGGFAIFPSMQIGTAAQQKLLNSKYQSGLDTLHKLYYGFGGTKGWLGSGADLKDAKSAIANTSKMTGIGEYEHINPNQLAMIRQAMANNEGMIGAKLNAPIGSNKTVTNTVSIQNQTINTKATDANGIAKDMHIALQQNNLINAGIYGAD